MLVDELAAKLTLYVNIRQLEMTLELSRQSVIVGIGEFYCL